MHSHMTLGWRMLHVNCILATSIEKGSIRKILKQDTEKNEYFELRRLYRRQKQSEEERRISEQRFTENSERKISFIKLMSESVAKFTLLMEGLIIDILRMKLNELAKERVEVPFMIESYCCGTLLVRDFEHIIPKRKKFDKIILPHPTTECKCQDCFIDFPEFQQKSTQSLIFPNGLFRKRKLIYMNLIAHLSIPLQFLCIICFLPFVSCLSLLESENSINHQLIKDNWVGPLLAFSVSFQVMNQELPIFQVQSALFSSCSSHILPKLKIIHIAEQAVMQPTQNTKRDLVGSPELFPWHLNAIVHNFSLLDVMLKAYETLSKINKALFYDSTKVLGIDKCRNKFDYLKHIKNVWPYVKVTRCQLREEVALEDLKKGLRESGKRSGSSSKEKKRGLACGGYLVGLPSFRFLKDPSATDSPKPSFYFIFKLCHCSRVRELHHKVWLATKFLLFGGFVNHEPADAEWCLMDDCFYPHSHSDHNKKNNIKKKNKSLSMNHIIFIMILHNLNYSYWKNDNSLTCCKPPFSPAENTYCSLWTRYVIPLCFLLLFSWSGEHLLLYQDYIPVNNSEANIKVLHLQCIRLIFELETKKKLQTTSSLFTRGPFLALAGKFHKSCFF
ncbi:putative signal peptide protein [Puccinia sorghi]|uniref:Putative signal peptide protein n=1 Tax=Puccinia sorghi TaxID=27349 RepID=A0A0L6UST6_9BASI|nr:putative signal peptide protein [Puccinia sorghi]